MIDDDIWLFREGEFTDCLDDVGQDDSVGDIAGQVLNAPLGFDLFQVAVGPVGVDLSSP